MAILARMNAKNKKHLETVGYYAEKQGEELTKVTAYLAENNVSDTRIVAEIEAVKAGSKPAAEAIAVIDGILGEAAKAAAVAEQAAAQASK